MLPGLSGVLHSWEATVKQVAYTLVLECFQPSGVLSCISLMSTHFVSWRKVSAFSNSERHHFTTPRLCYPDKQSRFGNVSPKVSIVSDCSSSATKLSNEHISSRSLYESAFAHGVWGCAGFNPGRLFKTLSSASSSRSYKKYRSLIVLLV